MMRVLDLFSGIGGFSLGLERVGMTTIGFCEIDPYCQKILRRHWSHVPIHTDIKLLKGEWYRGQVEVVCGGFPCQPFSSAGKQRGAEDDRFLWPEMLRVIRESQPNWVLGENVSGLVGMELDQVLSGLEETGYATRSFLIPACGVDAPHRRNRTWIVAHRNNARQRTGKGAGYHSRQAEVGDHFGGSSSPAPGPRQRDSSPARWEDEPRVSRISNGVPNRMDRIRCLGNSVVPQIVEELGKQILTAENFWANDALP